MTVLLTGGAGYIGSHVAVELLQSGYDVIIADNFYNSSQEVPERIRKITGKSVRTYNVDIQNSAALEQIFKQHEINAVMHFAGYKAVGKLFSSRSSIIEETLTVPSHFWKPWANIRLKT